MAAAGIEVGGVEYIVDDRDGQRYYYDINALSNFVADAPRVVGFDPFARLADFLEAGGRGDALRLLAPGVRRLAPQRGRRADGADVGLRAGRWRSGARSGATT